MICVVNCYGQRAHAQQLARVGQTERDGTASLWVGERRLTGRRDARRALQGVAGGARGRLVCRGGRNAFTSCTNYFRRTHAPHALRTTSHSRATCAFSGTHARTKTHAFLCPSSLFCCVLIRSGLLLHPYDKPISNPHQSRRTSTAK